MYFLYICFGLNNFLGTGFLSLVVFLGSWKSFVFWGVIPFFPGSGTLFNQHQQDMFHGTR